MKQDFQGIEDQAIEVLGKIRAAEDRVSFLLQEQKKSNAEKEEFEKVIEEMKNSLAELNSDLDKIKSENKKLKEESDKHHKKITQNRDKFRDICAQYDFLGEID